MQLTSSNPVPHDNQEGVQVHSGPRALPFGVQASGQCLEASILGAPACYSLQVRQHVGHSHSAWDRAHHDKGWVGEARQWLGSRMSLVRLVASLSHSLVEIPWASPFLSESNFPPRNETQSSHPAEWTKEDKVKGWHRVLTRHRGCLLPLLHKSPPLFCQGPQFSSS